MLAGQTLLLISFVKHISCKLLICYSQYQCVTFKIGRRSWIMRQRESSAIYTFKYIHEMIYSWQRLISKLAITMIRSTRPLKFKLQLIEIILMQIWNSHYMFVFMFMCPFFPKCIVFECLKVDQNTLSESLSIDKIPPLILSGVM